MPLTHTLLVYRLSKPGDNKKKPFKGGNIPEVLHIIQSYTTLKVIFDFRH